MRIYNRPLSPEEIEDLYQENSGSVGVRHHTPEKNGMVIYPNPVNGDLRYDIRESGLEIEGYVIIGAAGNTIRSVHTLNKNGPIPLERLNPGIYNLGLRTTGQMIHHKFIIQSIIL